MNSLATKFLIFGLVTLGFSVPLMFRAVPMNRYYGFRVTQAFQSDENWYEINAHGGRFLALGALVIIAVAVAGYFLPEIYGGYYRVCSIVMVGASILAPLVYFGIWLKRFGH